MRFIQFEQMVHSDTTTIVVPEHIKNKSQYKYCKRYAEKRKETQTNYYQKNKEHLKAKSRENYQKNKAKRIAQATELETQV